MAASSRNNDSDRILPSVLKLAKRSIEMKPSSFSSSGRRLAAISRYSCLRPSAGSTSKMTAIMSSTLETRDARAVRWFEPRRTSGQLHELLAEIRALQHPDESCGCIAQALGHRLAVLELSFSDQLGELAHRAQI